MGVCKNCGSQAVQRNRLAEYHDDLVGIPVVVLDAVEQEICAVCKKPLGIVIPNLEGLIAAVAVYRATVPYKLSGDEIKFMRHALGWKAKELAARLEVDPATVSRWENDPTKPITNQTEHYLRLVVCTLLGGSAPEIRWDGEDIVNMKIRSVRPAGPLPMRFRLIRVAEQPAETKEVWKTAKVIDFYLVKKNFIR